MENNQLKAFIERIERLEKEKASLVSDIKEVYSEAKHSGFDIKALKEVIKIRKQDQRERQQLEAILELYLAAIGMSPKLDD